MKIKIIGSNCSNGIKLRKALLKAVNNYDEAVEIELKDDQESMKKYNIKNIPALIINNQKCVEGKVPSDREILKFIKSYATKLMESICFPFLIFQGSYWYYYNSIFSFISITAHTTNNTQYFRSFSIFVFDGIS